ncbi:MAG: HNH endonuclease [archaeon]|nr:hypothetical protein [Nanoarchaeota archaeon]
MEKECVKCGKLDEKHAKGLCYKCYRKQWKPKKVLCKNCKQIKEHHAKGMCKLCVTKLFHYDHIKSYNVRKYHNISLELYKKIATECIICGFNKIIELHHLDDNRDNNSPNNLIPLCPNHHKMLHHQDYSEKTKSEIKKILQKRNV